MGGRKRKIQISKNDKIVVERVVNFARGFVAEEETKEEETEAVVNKTKTKEEEVKENVFKMLNEIQKKEEKELENGIKEMNEERGRMYKEMDELKRKREFTKYLGMRSNIKMLAEIEMSNRSCRSARIRMIRETIVIMKRDLK